MTKTQLQLKIDSLKLSVQQSNDLTSKYTNEIEQLQKQLDDLNKPKLTPLQFDELHTAIEEAVGSFDFDDTDNYDTDFHIDYDNRIAIESMSFHNADELVREIYSKLEELFAEATAPEDEISTQEHLNQN
mgnify:CR=1 FL=1|tara:strand:- start:231 stop:620 length:390 start_codon:yes stop_codon:yes gene_type:complete